MTNVKEREPAPALAPDSAQEKDWLCINTIRTLAIDAVQKANSGHPGAPMAMAPLVYTLWQKFLRTDPADPHWINRDRFVLSCGHASMLLYAVLHLSGVKTKSGEPAVSLEDIKNFRQIGSRTPGHPEYGMTEGVETTTGPLGQGCGNSVGMAMAALWLKARYNRPDAPVFDYDIYTLCSDGDLMEGVASEAASLAGHLKLHNLCWIYDSNRISIEGSTQLAFTENAGERFKAYGWNVLHVADANDLHAIEAAFTAFKAERDRPTIIIVTSIIGFGAPNKQNTSSIHSDALGVEEVILTKRAYGWLEDAQFLVPDGVTETFRSGIGVRGAGLHAQWEKLFEAYGKTDPALAKEIDLIGKRQLPEGWDKDLPQFAPDAKGLATREASGKVLNALAKNCPWILGGSADLAPSTKTKLTFDGAGTFEAGHFGGRNMHFGVREHAMASIVNGLALAGLRSYGSTFLVFSDYMRPALRLSSLMDLPSLQIFTHDSIGVGEDGPTHQPVEHLASLRAIPGLITLRPADANEVAEAYKVIMQTGHRPVALVLSRQALPVFDRTVYASAEGVAKGAYILADCPDKNPKVILIGTGSEVQFCIGAFEELKKEGVAARVVSMPSWELFENQPQSYRDEVLPPAVSARVTVEQAGVLGWDRYAGAKGKIIGMHTFGASAPLKDLLNKFGFSPEKVKEAASALLAGQTA